MARRLPEALRVESMFSEAELDYLVETGAYTGGLLLKRDLTGAFFYVAPKDLPAARDVLTKNKLRPYQPE